MGLYNSKFNPTVRHIKSKFNPTVRHIKKRSAITDYGCGACNRKARVGDSVIVIRDQDGYRAIWHDYCMASIVSQSMTDPERPGGAVDIEIGGDPVAVARGIVKKVPPRKTKAKLIEEEFEALKAKLAEDLSLPLTRKERPR